jgi:hypothetical protein
MKSPPVIKDHTSNAFDKVVMSTFDQANKRLMTSRAGLSSPPNSQTNKKGIESK